ncbi:AraC family transcriptional regulator N-terminal domain-containing protein (plasmid) [Nitrobacteraceae bacterium UC4446_H13]
MRDTVRRYADAHSDRHGVARTPIDRLSLMRATTPSTLQYAISRPLVALVLQGSKSVTMGNEAFDFGAGESLLITADVPTISQITRASLRSPYLSLVVDLDPATIAGLVAEMDAASTGTGLPVNVGPTDADVENVVLRLLQLLDRPSSLRLLQDQLMRELHFWLLTGRHGSEIRSLGVVDGHAHRIARAVSIIRDNYAHPLRVEHLAETAGMSISSFYEHFRAITSLTPLQFQKQLRLIEARRMMLADGAVIANAAHAVGYESVSQFTREYRRMFGLPPARDIRTTKNRVQTAA